MSRLLWLSRDNSCAAAELARGQDRHLTARQHEEVAYCIELGHPETAVLMA